MPNWCRGTLKVRGKKKNVIEFMLKGLKPVGPGRPLALNKFENIDSDETYWIENTYRGFVLGVDEFFSDYEDEDIVTVALDSKFAWDIDQEGLLKTCIKYSVDMKIYGFEKGMHFNRNVEIVNAEIIKDEEINFDDYEWECICPNIGG
jgi:hypothetical protein